MEFEIQDIKIKERDILYFPNHDDMYIIYDIIKSPILSRNGTIKYSLYDRKGVKYEQYRLENMLQFLSRNGAEIHDFDSKDDVFWELKRNFLRKLNLHQSTNLPK
jgi:hypothetical protein